MRRIGVSFAAATLAVLIAAGAHAQPPKSPATPQTPSANQATPQAQSSAQAAPRTQPAAAGSPIDGRWEGTVDTPDGPSQAIAELKLDGGVIKGTMTAGQYSLVITGGTLNGEAVSLAFDVSDMPGTMTATLKDGVLEGSWSVGGDGGGFTLKKTVAAAPAPAAPAAPVAPPAPAALPAPAAPAATSASAMTAAELSGDWDAAADVGGQTMPFTLTLKVEGEKVSGSTSSDRGSVALEGTYAAGVLTFGFATSEGMSIVMTGRPEAGKITGTFDVNGGTAQGGWSAAKRK